MTSSIGARIWKRLLYATLIVGGIILFFWAVVPVSWEVLCPKKTIEEVKVEFINNQERFDELVRVYSKISRRTYIALKGDDSISIDVIEENASKMSIAESSPDDPSVSKILVTIGLARKDFDYILSLMQKINPRSDVGRSSDGKIIVVGYRDGCRCAWEFLTPRGSYDVEEIIREIPINEGKGEKGPYTLNERWVIYRRCAG
jgi:hypothetical protein